MKGYSLMFFIICLNVAAFIINESGAIVESKELYLSPLDIYDPTTGTGKFGLTLFFVLLAGAGAIGIIGIIFQQNIFAIGALLVWVLGGLTPIIQWFLLGTPIILAQLLPGELSYLSVAIGAFFAVAFFMFLMEIVSQRQVT